MLNNYYFCKTKNLLDMKISLVVIELLNNGFVIYGTFCKKILNNIYDNNIDVYCTIYQHMYFGNISLCNMNDEILRNEFILYLKIIFNNHENAFINVEIMKNKNDRYIVCYYDDIKINIEINNEHKYYNFLCDTIEIQKKEICTRLCDNCLKNKQILYNNLNMEYLKSWEKIDCLNC